MISDKEVRCLKYFESGEHFEKYTENIKVLLQANVLSVSVHVNV